MSNNEHDAVICYLDDGFQRPNSHLSSLYQNLQTTLRCRALPMTWVDCSNSGTVITENKYISKIGGGNAWDKAARAEQPLTKGVNTVEFVVENTTSDRTDKIIVVGVHPTPDLKPGSCDPGFHVSSVGVAFGSINIGSNGTTGWVADTTVRLEVNFTDDKIRLFSNDQLMIENDVTHAPSMLKGCYVSFMIHTDATRIRILSSKMVWH